MHHYSQYKKGNSSFLSISPFSYAVELTAESPLFNFWERTPNPLADCVKSASLLLLGIKNLCSSFWRHNTVLTWARVFYIFLAPFPFSARVRGESPTANSVDKSHIRFEPCLCWKTIKNFTVRKERNEFVFNRKVCDKQVRLISNRESDSKALFRK